MIEPTQRPRRPPQLIIALVALTMASLLFGMTLMHLGGPTPQSSNLGTVALLFSLLAIRFSWARATAVVLLAILTLMSLPNAIAYVSDESVSQAAVYVLIGTTFFVPGAVLAHVTASNQYYEQSARWRYARKHQLG